MRKQISFLLALILFLIIPHQILAAKARTSRSGGGTGSTSGSVATSGRVTTSARFRSDRRAIIISFAGLSNASSVNYSLTYDSNGIAQGAMGTMTNIAGSSDSRELLFGTCSHGVCRYHTGITNARLVITSKLKSGLTTRKSYRLKV